MPCACVPVGCRVWQGGLGRLSAAWRGLSEAIDLAAASCAETRALVLASLRLRCLGVGQARRGRGLDRDDDAGLCVGVGREGEGSAFFWKAGRAGDGGATDTQALYVWL
jgi:hypothetical protein